ncbi:MAG: penicillin-binding protein 1B [Gammaproteobacteria bacterium]|nr:penicillin-binding protein 1B [Gammaproteobacteria bacterium]MCW8911458.1 penicillin-binding protein 1B [Gammaproteobacteria bacterium]MCW9003763.1 penicillin-binding protein 1B [Gammaproteobacteria bacterium]
MVRKTKSTKQKTSKSRRSTVRQWTFKSLLFSPKVMIYFYLPVLLLSVFYIVYLDLRVTSKFEGSIWSLPAQVYARPLELYVDKKLTAKQFEQELQLIGYRSTDNIPVEPGQYRFWNERHFELITHDFKFWDGQQKSRALRIDFSYGSVRELKDLYGHNDIDLVRLEPARIAGIYPTHAEDREIIKLEDVNKRLPLALLAVEDRRFYKHWGVDPRAIARAFLANITPGGSIQGGSTLTQQLVKNLFLTSERSLWRKFNEAIMAVLLEFHYDKALILETYLNEIYLGQDGSRGVHGFALASQYYFSRTLDKLTTDQLALLVGLVKGASWYDPRRHPERALERRNQVLSLMSDQGVISEQQYEVYAKRPLSVTSKPNRSSNRFPAFIDMVKRQLKSDYDEKDLRSEGLKIFTTLEPYIQFSAEASVETTIPQLERSYQNAEGLETAVIVISPENGEIQAIIGGRNPRYPGFNRAIDAVRQVGSLIKPAIYLSALQHTGRYHLASVLEDSPLHLKERNGRIWSPQNYDKEFVGDILLYQAMMYSRNVPTVRLGLDIGLADIVKSINALGVKREVPPYPSMTLGAFNLTPLEVASMYQTIAANGFDIPLRAIREVTDTNGKPLKRYALKLEQTLDSKALYLIKDILHRVTQEGTARSLKNRFDVKLAGKTGTSDDLRDSWFAGFGENHLAVVWVGRDDNQATGLTGASGALKIWSRLMSALPLESIQHELPVDMELRWIDVKTGGLTKKACEGAVELPFVIGSAPEHWADCDSGSGLQWLKKIFE